MIIHSYTASGVKHTRNAQLSQDYVITANIDEETRIIAVSDGVSSARFARNAAVAACYAAVNFSQNYHDLKSIFNNDDASEVFAKELFEHVACIIEKLSQKHDAPVFEYATTLLVSIVTENHDVFALQLGDGFIRIDDKILPFVRPDRMKKNITFSTANLITSIDRKIYTLYRGHFSQHVIVMTDGLEPIAKNRQLMRYLSCDAALLVNKTALREVCEACSEINFDDTTIVIAVDPIGLIEGLSTRELLTLFGLKEKAVRRNKNGSLKQYIQIFSTYQTPRSISEVASMLQINAITVSKITKHLIGRNLLKKLGRGFSVHTAYDNAEETKKEG